MGGVLFTFRQGINEVATVYWSPGYMYLTAGPSIAVPGDPVKVFSNSSRRPAVWRGGRDQLEGLQRLRKLPLSKAALKVVDELLRGWRDEALGQPETDNVDGARSHSPLPRRGRRGRGRGQKC